MRLFATLHLASFTFLASSFVLDPAFNHHLTLTSLTLPLHAMVADCVRITDPPMTGLKPTVCENVALIQCQRLDEIPVQAITRNKWFWTEEPGCAMGWYFPRDARIPTLGACELIYEAMVERCARDSKFNGATTNVADLPNFGDDGKAMSEDRGMFIMAPERMTL